MTVRVVQYRRRGEVQPGSFEVDVRIDHPRGGQYRERVLSPVTGRAAAKAWGVERERAVVELFRQGLDLAQIRRKLRGEERDPRQVTTGDYLRSWIKRREDAALPGAPAQKARLTMHVVPWLGRVMLAELRPHHVRDLLRDLQQQPSKKGGMLSARSRRHVYFTLRQALHDAVVDELIPANPAQVARSEVPPKLDKDPSWRRTAVFTREEVETLISDARVAEDHRVVCALAFLTGARHGEVAALRWRHLETTAEPLGKLTIEVAFNSARHIEKGVKTDRPRLVPLHPTLAKVLASWRLSGWERAHGRKPGPDDLIVPSTGGGHRTAQVTLELFHDDLARLGMRERRFHDARRTFISLCLGDGASKDMLRWVTHAPGDVFDGYTSPPWTALCEAVGKLRVRLPEPGGAEVIPLPFADSRGGGGEAPAMS